MDHEREINLGDDTIKEIVNSLSDLLWGLFEEGFDDLDVLIDHLIEGLLKRGPIAFEEVKHRFPENAEQQIMENESYKNYLNNVDKAKSGPANDKVAGSNDDENSLEGAFEKLRKEQKDEYDTNFTLVYGLKDSTQIKKELLISETVMQYRNREFLGFFNVFRAFLFDLLKRREGFEEFVQLLRRFSAKEKANSQKVVKNLEVKDLIILLLESCSKKSVAKLGPWLTTQYYPLPIFYLVGKKSSKLNLDCCSELMFQTKKPLITSIGTQNSVNKGKSSLLSYLFTTKNPAFLSTQNGFTHPGSVDLYVKLPQDGFKYIVADVNGQSQDKEFEKICARLLVFSQLVLVHITEQDVTQDSLTGKATIKPLVDSLFTHKTKFVILFRDYDEDAHSSLEAEINDSLKGDSNYLGIITVPKLDSLESYDVQNEKQRVYEELTEKLATVQEVNFFPISEIKKSIDLDILPKPGDQLTLETELDKESNLIKEMLDTKLQESQSKGLYKTLFPCFWADFLLNNEIKKIKVEKTYGEVTEAYAAELSNKYAETADLIRSYASNKERIGVSELVKKISLILSSGDLARILFLSETINNWKLGLYEPIKERYIELKSKMEDNKKAEMEKEINQLEKEMDDKDISLDSFLDEMHSLYEAGKIKNAEDSEGIKSHIYSNLKQGAPLNLINGKNLKFGSKLLKEQFEKFDKNNKKTFVISIIGAQSSAKSTLLNVLFGCGFATSAGRCTKGLYISLLKHPNGCHLIVIDTEGLLSVVARDHEFDNLITSMAFSCSHLVIINNKGEINSKLRDLLETCVYAMKHLQLTLIKPKVIFALRDIADDNKQVQQEMLMQMKDSLEQAAKKLEIKASDFIDISEQDVYLLPSAFQLSSGENGAKIQTNNNLFSQKVLEMRNRIFKFLSIVSMDSSSMLDLKWFYIQSEQIWNDLNEQGKDIMKVSNLSEIELEEEALEKMISIYNEAKAKLIKQAKLLLDHQKSQLEAKNFTVQSDFEQMLTKEFHKVKSEAVERLEREVINHEKYAVIAGYHQELRQALEHYLGWQRQSFMSEWKNCLVGYSVYKGINDFKLKLKDKLEMTLGSKQSARNISDDTLNSYSDFRDKANLETKERAQKLQEENISKLVPKIHCYFDCAKQKRGKENREHVIVPSAAELFDRITEHYGLKYNESKWVKLNKIVKDNDKTIETSINESADIVSKGFMAIKSLIKQEVKESSSEEVAAGLISLCVEKVNKLEGQGLPVNTVALLQSCILEAMYYQYAKEKEIEASKTKSIQKELAVVLENEEQEIQNLLDRIQDSYHKGVTTGIKCYKEIQRTFCDDQELEIFNPVMKKLREKFPGFESIETKGDAKRVNLLEDEQISVITNFEVEKRMENFKDRFIDLVHETITVVNAWGNDQAGVKKVDLSTLFGYAQSNEKLRPYFPDLYIIQITDLQSFLSGFRASLDNELKKANVKDEIREIVMDDLERYLNRKCPGIATLLK